MTDATRLALLHATVYNDPYALADSTHVQQQQQQRRRRHDDNVAASPHSDAWQVDDGAWLTSVLRAATHAQPPPPQQQQQEQRATTTRDDVHAATARQTTATATQTCERVACVDAVVMTDGNDDAADVAAHATTTAVDAAPRDSDDNHIARGDAATATPAGTPDTMHAAVAQLARALDDTAARQVPALDALQQQLLRFLQRETAATSSRATATTGCCAACGRKTDDKDKANDNAHATTRVCTATRLPVVSLMHVDKQELALHLYGLREQLARLADAVTRHERAHAAQRRADARAAVAAVRSRVDDEWSRRPQAATSSAAITIVRAYDEEPQPYVKPPYRPARRQPAPHMTPATKNDTRRRHTSNATTTTTTTTLSSSSSSVRSDTSASSSSRRSSTTSTSSSSSSSERDASVSTASTATAATATTTTSMSSANKEAAAALFWQRRAAAASAKQQ